MTQQQYPVVRNKILRIYMYASDFLLSLISSKSKCSPTGSIKKILFYNPAALGDVWYTLRLVRAMKEYSPDIEVGLLVGSGSAKLVRAVADVDHVHTLDHPIVNRSRICVGEKFLCWYKTRRQSLREIRALKYDVAVDLYYYFPGAGHFMAEAGIPRRVGYDAREGVRFYTDILHWEIKDIHNIEYQAALLREIGLPLGELTTATPMFRQEVRLEEVEDRLKPHGYIVLSVGTGAPIREWKIVNWQVVLQKLEAYNLPLVVVGAGKKEQALIDGLATHYEGTLFSLCNKLNYAELAVVIQNARLFIGLESFAGHVAAAYKVPQVSIMHGGCNLYHWQPYGNSRCQVVRKPMKCSPCYFPSNCPRGNECMEITAGEVMEAVQELWQETEVNK